MSVPASPAPDAIRDAAPGFVSRWCFVAVLILFSALPLYVSIFVAPGLQPLHWTLVLALSLLPAVLYHRLFRIAPLSAGAVWALVYMMICLVWFGASGAVAEKIMAERLLALGVFLIMFLVASQGEATIRAARHALLVGVLLAVACNVYETMNPFSFVPLSSEFANPGRAAGLYINANASATAILFGMVVALSLVPPRWRWLFVSVAGAGIALTLSRAGIIGFVLATMLLRVGGMLRTGDLVRVLLLVLAAAAVAWFVLLPMLAARFDVNMDLLQDRVMWFLSPQARADFSQQERLELAELAWEQFAQHPLLGNGVGSTEAWLARSSTHNMYLQLASDFGFIGLMVLPALALTFLARPASDAARSLRVLAALLLLFGLVSHNLLTDVAFIVIMAVAAAHAYLDRQKALVEPRGQDPRSPVHRS
jgi:O-antigen ligase